MVGEEKQPRNQINLNPVQRLFEDPQKSLEPYVKKSQVAADLGCSKGYYTFALAECVGPEREVYAVDLRGDFISVLQKKGDEGGYHNIEWHVASAADMNFIKDESVDFVLANGLLCNVPDHRELVANEIQRILKPTGRAYISLGGVSPFFGFVGRAEWERILEAFIIKHRGGLIQKWADVSEKESSRYVAEPTGRPIPQAQKRTRRIAHAGGGKC